jgi:hypothetical protein
VTAHFFRRTKNIFRKKNTMQRAPKNKYHCLLADQKSVKTPIKKSVRRIFRQLPSHAKAENKIYKVWSLGHGSCVRAWIAQTFPIASKRANGTVRSGRIGYQHPHRVWDYRPLLY